MITILKNMMVYLVKTNPPKMSYPRKSKNSFWELTDENVLDFVFALKKGSVLNPQDYNYPAGPVFAETVKWCEKEDGKSNIEGASKQMPVITASASKKTAPSAPSVQPDSKKTDSKTAGKNEVVFTQEQKTQIGRVTPSLLELRRADADVKERRIADGKEELPESKRITTKEPDGVDSKTEINVNVNTKTRPRADTIGGGMIGGYAGINPFETNWLLTDKNLIKQM